MTIGCCRICSGNELTQVLDFGVVPAAHCFRLPEQRFEPTPEFPLVLVRCDSCGLVQLKTDWQGTWDGANRHPDERDVSEEQSRRLAGAIVSRMRIRSRAWVVEACGERPPVLSSFWRRGCRVLALEPLPITGIRPKAGGLEIVRETFDAELAADLRSQFGPAQLFIANDVLPFLGLPLEFFRGVQRLLAEDGLAVFETPHLSLLSEQLEFDRVMHDRLIYYSLAAMESAAMRVGLRIVDVDSEALPQGVLRAWFGREEGRHSATPRVADARNVESAMQLDRMRTWRLCGRRIEQACARIHALIADVVENGLTLAVYGGSNRAANLLNLCRIRREHVQLVVDPIPRRQGMLLPGLGLPIVSPDELVASRPDRVLIVNGARAGELATRHADYVRLGGRFIEATAAPRPLAFAA